VRRAPINDAGGAQNFLPGEIFGAAAGAGSGLQTREAEKLASLEPALVLQLFSSDRILRRKAEHCRAQNERSTRNIHPDFSPAASQRSG